MIRGAFWRRFLPVSVAVALSACGAQSQSTGAPAGHAKVELFVSAASSLTEAFGDMASAFERAHPGTTVLVNLAGSPQLVSQVKAGAQVDVLATADLQSMAAIAAAGLVVGTSRPFAQNQLEIAVAAGNPYTISGLADLAKPGLRVSLAAPTVPAGKYAQQALASAGVKVAAASLEPDVRSVVTRVSSGVADAGIVYATDIRAAGATLTGVTIATQDQQLATYPIGVVSNGKAPAMAKAFVAFVLSPAGQRIMAARGFLPPPPGSA